MSALICLVCGLEISKERYNINKNSRASENKPDEIICCPYCGVGSEHFGSCEEYYLNSIGNIDDNVKVIIDHAMKLEVFNGEFYKKASMMAKDEKVKSMFSDLSKVEIMHALVHKKIIGAANMPVLKDIDYSRLTTDEMLINEANKREQHAVNFYNKYSKEISDEKIITILQALKHVEEEHIEITN